jgi:hypothetical protein
MKDGPFELWDLRNMCILRTMPKKFPSVTALVSLIYLALSASTGVGVRLRKILCYVVGFVCT